MYNLTQATMTMDYNVMLAQSAGIREPSHGEIEFVNGRYLRAQDFMDAGSATMMAGGTVAALGLFIPIPDRQIIEAMMFLGGAATWGIGKVWSWGTASRINRC